MLRVAALSALLCSALAAPAVAADWSDRDICRAGIQTFFQLPEAPIDDASADFRDHMGFEGRNGIIRRQYACRVQKDRIAIRWFVNGHRKRDARTTWEVDGDALLIHAKNSEARYEAK